MEERCENCKCDNKTDWYLVEAINGLADNIEELTVKIKRATSANPFLNGKWEEVKRQTKENKEAYDRLKK